MLQGHAEALLALLEGGEGVGAAPAEPGLGLIGGGVAQRGGDDLAHDLQGLGVAVAEGAGLGRQDGEGAHGPVQVVEGDDQQRAGAELEGQVPVDAGVPGRVVGAQGLAFADGRA